MNPKPSLLESQPVAVAGGAVGVVALIMAGLLMLNSLGVLALTPEQLDAIKTFLIPAVAIIGPPVAALWARGRVTPLADPHTADREPAVLVSRVEAQQLGIAPDGKL